MSVFDGSFVPLQNYTTLKQKLGREPARRALYPYKITLLSNNKANDNNKISALYPYKITLLSNLKQTGVLVASFII